MGRPRHFLSTRDAIRRAVLCVLVDFTAASCSNDTLNAGRIETDPGTGQRTLLSVELGACYDENDLPEYRHTETEATVTIRPIGGTKINADCSEGTRIVLDEPLGTRRVRVEGFDGTLYDCDMPDGILCRE